MPVGSPGRPSAIVRAPFAVLNANSGAGHDTRQRPADVANRATFFRRRGASSAMRLATSTTTTAGRWRATSRVDADGVFPFLIFARSPAPSARPTSPPPRRHVRTWPKEVAELIADDVQNAGAAILTILPSLSTSPRTASRCGRRPRLASARRASFFLRAQSLLFVVVGRWRTSSPSSACSGR
jgi:hypothetical protein